MGAFVGPFGGNVTNVLIPRIQDEFAISFYLASMTISIYMIAFAGFQLISGIVSDMLGRRNAVLFGYGIFSAGSIICYCSYDFKIFLLGRFIQGLGNAFMTPILMALLGDAVPKEDLGKFMGIFGSIQTSGIFIAPLAGGVFAELNWRYVFLVLFLISLLLIIAYYFIFNYKSRVYKRKPMAPASYGKLILNRRVILLAMSSFAGYFGFGSLGFLFSKYINLKLGVSETVNGTIVSMTGLGSILFSPFAGSILDRYDRSSFCMTGILFIVPIIYMVQYANNIFILSIMLFIMGGFSAMVWSSLNTLSVDTFPEIRGTISSLVNSFKYFSFSISPVFYGKIYETSGIGAAFASASAVTALQFIIMAIYRKQNYHVRMRGQG